MTLLRRVTLALAILCGVSALVVAVSGGFAIRAGWLRLSSHRTDVPAILSVVFAALAIGRFGWRAVRDDLERISAPSSRFWTSVAAAAALLILTFAIQYGTFTAGGSDSYGYISQSRLWLARSLRVAQPIVAAVPWPDADWTFSPLGYRPVPPPGTIVPTYPAGLPLLMALAHAVAGADAVYYVVPLCGALAVWLAFVLGQTLHSTQAGALGAIFLALSPVFLFQVVQPLSDVPVTAAWLAVFVLACRPGAGHALGAGLAASAALLIRPNLAPVAVVPCVMMLVRFDTDTTTTGKLARVGAFIAGVAPGGLAIAAMQAWLYGSPLTSGYGTLDALFAVGNIEPNLAKYTTWALSTQSPVFLLAPFGPFLLSKERKRIAISLVVFAAAVLACYLPYTPFDDWWYIRFLLPALAPLLVLTAVVMVAAIGRLPASARLLATIFVAVTLGSWYFGVARTRGVLELKTLEARYVTAGRYVAATLPGRAIPFAVQESGSVRHYSGRITLRWDHMEPAWLERAIASLHGQGYTPYFLLEDWEEPAFRARFAAASPLGRLDWPPMAELKDVVTVRIYNPEDRARFVQGLQVRTDRRITGAER